MKRERGFDRRGIQIFAAVGLLTFAGWVRAAFEENARGARGIAMGDAYGAVADTADGLFWNPAALVRVPMKQVLGTHADLFTGIENVDVMTDGLNYAHPTLRHGVWAAGWNSLNAKNVYGEDTVTLGYARDVGVEVPFLKGSDIALGANLKYMRTRYTNDTSTINDPVFAGGKKNDAVTGDVGALVRAGPVTTGLSFRNVTEPDFGFKESDRVPMETRLSGAYAGRLWFLDNMTLALDLVLTREDTRLCAGWENVFFGDQGAVRLGVNPDEFTTGLGWRYVAARPALDLGLDYAYVLPLDMADNQSVTHRFSLNVRFGR